MNQKDLDYYQSTRQEYREKRMIFSSAIRELEEPLFSLLTQLRERLDQDIYGYLIGDHFSGHFPSIAMAIAINKLRIREGRSSIPLFFVIGTGNSYYACSMEAQLQQKLTRIKKVHQSKRALLVTDVIDEGSTIRQFHDILTRNEIAFDVATVQAMHRVYKPGNLEFSEEYRDVFQGVEAVFFAGDEGLVLPKIYGDYQSIGIYKGVSSKFVIEKYPLVPELRESAKNALFDTHLLADRLVERFAKVS